MMNSDNLYNLKDFKQERCNKTVDDLLEDNRVLTEYNLELLDRIEFLSQQIEMLEQKVRMWAKRTSQ